MQRPRETLFQFRPEESSTQELCVVLTLEPGTSSHALPTTGTSVPMSPRPGSPAPQLAGIWADRSHVIRPRPPSSDSLRRPLISPSSPNDITRTSFSPSSSESPRSSRLTSDVGAGQVGAGQVGAWGKPGSGAAVVKRMGEPHPHIPGPHPHTPGPHLPVARHLKHSVSGPIRAYCQGASNQGSPHRISEGSQGQGKGQQKGWSRVSDRKGERSKVVGPILEQDERYQRSHSTTHAHQQQQQQANRKPHPHRKPHSEPNHHDTYRKS